MGKVTEVVLWSILVIIVTLEVDGSVNINDEQLKGKPTSGPHLAISTGSMRLSGLQAEVVG